MLILSTPFSGFRSVPLQAGGGVLRSFNSLFGIPTVNKITNTRGYFFFQLPFRDSGLDLRKVEVKPTFNSLFGIPPRIFRLGARARGFQLPFRDSRRQYSRVVARRVGFQLPFRDSDSDNPLKKNAPSFQLPFRDSGKTTKLVVENLTFQLPFRDSVV